MVGTAVWKEASFKSRFVDPDSERRSVIIEKVTNLAERAVMAVSHSRRGFLGRVGQAGLIAAGAEGAMDLAQGNAHAWGNGGACCFHANGFVNCVSKPNLCPATHDGSLRVSKEDNCPQC